MEAESASGFAAIVRQREEQLISGLDRVLAAAQPGAVFGPPVVSGEYTLITASEVSSGGGFGSGGGYGQGTPSSPSPAESSGDGAASAKPQSGGGFGGGGGGGAMGRPVAVIVIGPNGVKIKPIVDPTKIAIAVITAWVSFAMAFRGMRRFKRRGLKPG